MAEEALKYKLIVEVDEQSAARAKQALGGGSVGGGGGGGGPPAEGGGPSGGFWSKMFGGKGGGGSKFDAEGFVSKFGGFLSGNAGIESLFAGTSLAALGGIAAGLMSVIAPVALGLSAVQLRNLGLSLQNYSGRLFEAGTRHEMFGEGYKYSLAKDTGESLAKLIRTFDKMAADWLPIIKGTVNAAAGPLRWILQGVGAIGRTVSYISQIGTYTAAMIGSGFRDNDPDVRAAEAARNRAWRYMWDPNSKEFDEDRKLEEAGSRIVAAGINSMGNVRSSGQAPLAGQYVARAISLRQQGSLSWPAVPQSQVDFRMAENIQISMSDEQAISDEMNVLKMQLAECVYSMRAGRWMRMSYERCRLTEGII